jgi:CO/xanthine dehydrogenase FAD-binding subunit
VVNAFRPQTLEEALDVRRKNGVIPFAGGTDLMVQRRRGTGLVPDFRQAALFIGHLEELKRISSESSFLHIGACCTYSQLLGSPSVPPSLKKAIGEIGSPAVKNRGTMGGNVCNASPAGDTLPVLYALDAEVVLRSSGGSRILPVEDFILGPGKTSLKSNELLIHIRIPADDFPVTVYRKVGTRRANALSKLSFIGLARENTALEVRIAFGAVAPTVVRSRKNEALLRDMLGGGSNCGIAEICDLYSPLLEPIDDQRSNAHYRKEVSLRLLRNFIEGLTGENAAAGR